MERTYWDDFHRALFNLVNDDDNGFLGYRIKSLSYSGIIVVFKVDESRYVADILSGFDVESHLKSFIKTASKDVKCEIIF